MSEEQLRRMRAYGVKYSVEVGQSIYDVGMPITDLVLVESGAIDVFSAGTAISPEVFITRHTRGRFVGELSLLTGQFSYLVARVAEAGEVYRFRPKGVGN